MKLLSNQELIQQKSALLAQEAQRNINMENAAKIVRQNLAKANADFNSTMAKYNEVWAEEEQAHAKRVKEMKAEIAKLNELIILKKKKLEA